MRNHSIPERHEFWKKLKLRFKAWFGRSKDVESGSGGISFSEEEEKEDNIDEMRNDRSIKLRNVGSSPEAAREVSADENKQRKKVRFEDETQRLDGSDDETSGNPHNADSAPNLETGSTQISSSSALGQDHDGVVAIVEANTLPPPYDPYHDSCASSIEDCSSICAFGCQYGDECTMNLGQFELLANGFNSALTVSRPKTPFVGDDENFFPRGSTATTFTDITHDLVEDIVFEALPGPRISDELESLTSTSSTTSWKTCLPCFDEMEEGRKPALHCCDVASFGEEVNIKVKKVLPDVSEKDQAECLSAPLWNKN
ncbi:hypothetical protein FGB62_35g117 [Gracilaria domingensis]|nr:hypothetical protein FGB62_35g117 [Gracilaria domingensis]